MTLRMALAVCGVLLVCIIALFSWYHRRAKVRASRQASGRSSPFLNTMLSDDGPFDEVDDETDYTLTPASGTAPAAERQMDIDMQLPDVAQRTQPGLQTSTQQSSSAHSAAYGATTHEASRQPTQQWSDDKPYAVDAPVGSRVAETDWHESTPVAAVASGGRRSESYYGHASMSSTSRQVTPSAMPDTSVQAVNQPRTMSAGASNRVSAGSQAVVARQQVVNGRYNDDYNRALTNEIRERHQVDASAGVAQPQAQPYDARMSGDSTDEPGVRPGARSTHNNSTSTTGRTHPNQQQARVDRQSRQLEHEMKEVEDAINRTLSPSFDINLISDEPQIDYVAHIYGMPGAVQRMQVLSIYRQREFDLVKPHRLFGLSDPTGTWVDLEKDTETGQYSEIVITMQLADSKGCVSETDLTRFSDMTLSIAEAINGQFRFSHSLDDGLEQGRTLQSFCQRFDILTVINVLLPEGRVVTGEQVDLAARELGLVAGKMSIYHKSKGQGVMARERFSMANMFNPGTFDQKRLKKQTTRGVSLFFNLPVVSRPDDALEELITVARELCVRFDAQLVDQERKHLGDQGINLVRKTVNDMVRAMEEEGILPGSEKALKLFG